VGRGKSNNQQQPTFESTMSILQTRWVYSMIPMRFRCERQRQLKNVSSQSVQIFWGVSLIVVYTYRGERIISARRATSSERKTYEQGAT
jgi:hypothetical protein